MNAKQLACLLLLLGAVLLFQGAMTMRQKAQAAAGQAEAALAEQKKVKTRLNAENDYLQTLSSTSKSLVDFVSNWEPYFAILEDQQQVETGISMKVREHNIINLSQRYQQVAHTINNKPNESLPVLVRATLVFDDAYAKLLNWMGEMEQIKPTMRTGKVMLTRGSRGNDLRMELVLEVPLWAKEKAK